MPNDASTDDCETLGLDKPAVPPTCHTPTAPEPGIAASPKVTGTLACSDLGPKSDFLGGSAVCYPRLDMPRCLMSGGALVSRIHPMPGPVCHASPDAPR